MHLILTGATGLVGTAVLDAMIRTTDITKISVLSRRPVKFNDERINVILHKDFTSYDQDVLRKLEGAEACVWALGISQYEVNKEDYISITKTFPLAAANAFQSLSPSATPNSNSQTPPFHFIYVSGDGATTTPGRLTPFFGRVKGEAEIALDELQKLNPSTFRATTVRPGFVDWTNHQDLKPVLPELGWVKTTMGSVLSPMMNFGFRGKTSPTEPLGRFLTGLATGMWEGAVMEGEGVERLEGGLMVVGNRAVRKVMGLDAPVKK